MTTASNDRTKGLFGDDEALIVQYAGNQTGTLEIKPGRGIQDGFISLLDVFSLLLTPSVDLQDVAPFVLLLG